MTILRLSLLAIVACVLSLASVGASRAAEDAAEWSRLTFAVCGTSEDVEDGVMTGEATAIDDDNDDNDDWLGDDATVSPSVGRPETPLSRSGAGHRTGLRASLGFADCLFRPPRTTA